MTPSQLIEQAGGPLKLSRAIGHRTHTSVLKWKTIPAQHLAAIEAATGIPREQLRPDLYRPTDVDRPQVSDRTDAA